LARYKFDEDLFAAVRYLMKKGINSNKEIARRLNVSPGTVATVKFLLKRGVGGREGREERGERKVEEEVEGPPTVLDVLFSKRSGGDSKG